MGAFTDQINRTVNIPSRPQRIISTVPSQTELLCELGLQKQLIGVTAYCVHPHRLLDEKTVIGGTKDLQLSKIRELKPDLIIGNKEENIREQIEALANDFPVWISDVNTVDEALNMIGDIGAITDTAENAKQLVKEIEQERNKLHPSFSRKTAYFIWKDPWMVASQNTFISSMMEEGGMLNIFSHIDKRYPQITLEELQDSQIELVLLSSEPYKFTASDLHYVGNILPQASIKIIDGEMFSWYGSRMKKALRYVGNILH